jgi:SAM-dependent methyltransferase
MSNTISDEIWTKLCCPQCSGPVEITNKAVSCQLCNTTFPTLPNGGVDLRLQLPRQCQSVVTIEPFPLYPRLSFEPLKSAKPLDKEKRLSRLPPRISTELAARFPKATGKTALMLDLGCGKMIHRELVEHQGFRYVGLDRGDPGAMFLGDAQALPFTDGSFEFVLSISVLQEVPHPEMMIREAFRVLTPGGVFIGSAAYLESYSRTYHHFTHLGLNALLQQEGFAVEAIAPNPRWTAPISLLGNGLFPYMPRPLAVALVSPVYVGHRIWWWLGGFFHPQATESNRLLLTTGSFFFIARKPIV